MQLQKRISTKRIRMMRFCPSAVERQNTVFVWSVFRKGTLNMMLRGIFGTLIVFFSLFYFERDKVEILFWGWWVAVGAQNTTMVCHNEKR